MSRLAWAYAYAAAVLCAAFSLSATGHAQPAGEPHDCGRSAVEYQQEDGLTQAEIIARMDSAFVRSLNKFDECQDRNRADRQERSGSEAAGDLAGAESNGDGEQGETADGSADGSSASSDLSGQEPGSARASDSTAATDMTGTEGRETARSRRDTAGAGEESVASTDLSGEEPSPESGRANGAGSDGASVAAKDVSGTEVPDSDATGTVGQETGTEGPARVARANGKLPEDIPPADNDSVLEAQIRQAAIEETDPVLKKKLWNEYRRYKGLPQVE